MLAKLMSTQKRALAMKVSSDSVESVLDGIDKLAAMHLPWEWVDRPDFSEPVDSIEAFAQKAEMMYGNNN